MEEAVEQFGKIRITLNSKSFKYIEKVSADLLPAAKGMHLRVLGPSRLPTKVIKLKTRLAPCPRGENLCGSYELRVHQRIMYIFTSLKVVKQMCSDAREPDVVIEHTLVGYRVA